MGTRHNTVIISGGKEVFNTYGQWDGYADYAGVVIRDFLKIYTTEEIRNLLLDVKDAEEKPDKFHMAQATWGYTHNLSDIETFTDAYRYNKGEDVKGVRATVKATVEKFGFEKTMLYYMMSRNTGYQLLDVLEALHENNVEHKPILSFKTDADTGRIFTVDLDKEEFSIRLFDITKTWSFSKLPSYEELEKFEHEA